MGPSISSSPASSATEIWEKLLVRIEETCKFYSDLGKQWNDQGCQVFLWRTHAKTFHLPPRTKSMEQVLAELSLSSSEKQPTPPDTTSPLDQAAGEASSFQVRIVVDKPICEESNVVKKWVAETVKTWDVQGTYCPLCHWDYKTMVKWRYHFQRIHTWFRWTHPDEKSVRGRLRRRVYMFQVVEYVNATDSPYSSFFPLGFKEEECKFQVLEKKKLLEQIKDVKEGHIYVSTMKFATKGEEMSEMIKQTREYLEKSLKKKDKSPVQQSTGKRGRRKSFSVSPRNAKTTSSCTTSLATLNDRPYYHTVTLHQVAVEEEEDSDSESDYSEDWREELEMQMLSEQEEVVSERTKLFFRQWNEFIRNQRVFADFQLPNICYQYAKEHGKDIVQHSLLHTWRMHLLNLFEYGLIQRADIVQCCLALQPHLDTCPTNNEERMET